MRRTLRAPQVPAWETRVLEYLPLVNSMAAKMCARLPPQVDRDDLVQAGTLGLIDASKKYDTDKGVSFAAYAKFRIRGAIIDSLRQLDCVSRDARRDQKRIELAIAALTPRLGRAPNDEELALELGWTLKDLRKKLQMQDVVTISASTRRKGEEDLPVLDLPGAPNLQPDRICEQMERSRIVGDAVKQLPARQQQVVTLYYMHDMNMREIAREMGVNESRISQIHKSALEKMAAYLDVARCA